MNPQGFTKIEPRYIKVHKLDGRAFIPSKTEGQEDDIGYDVTLIGRTENRSDDELNKVNMFHTGFQIKPPEGYYLELFARSSLHKHGYMLATGVSIIDPGYEGELLVPLYKFSSEQEDISLPFSAVQLVLRKRVDAHISEEEIPFSSQSQRGDGGFGSTGNHPRSDPNRLGYDPNFGRNANLQDYRREPQSHSSQFY